MCFRSVYANAAMSTAHSAPYTHILASSDTPQGKEQRAHVGQQDDAAHQHAQHVEGITFTSQAAMGAAIIPPSTRAPTHNQ